ncbi:putative glucokinase [Aspergillus novofumigatus IBT 16806]|uniref:Phosphotransferase n=1 Tax=Aspergillus novofumigatus (strain IBT 16806) TaxID=1392255 RepID=A0A2I1CPC7_ASPN1|nr:hexokinase [Aspergillus novofumigatus IBT 16806]PKX99463.1 hexokinase [Aspergillus novofumigatus IBT 16806]
MAEANLAQQRNLLAQAEQIALEFDLSPEHVRQVTSHFVRQLRDGLANRRVWQLPSYVRNVSTGKEKGRFLAVDLGGSNCRICLVDLHGDSTFTVTQSKHSVPPTVMVNCSYRPLFDWLAQRIAGFLDAHLDPTSPSPYRLGFTFSFTCEQTSLAGGRLIHWDKGWDIPDAVGRDPCVMLQEAIDELGLPVMVTVLANDSVGTLLTRAYSSGQQASTLGAVIFGTGTNAAYVEKLSNVHRLGVKAGADDIMVMNTEWGCLDDKMEVLPRTSFDDALDAASVDPGSQMFEKRVSALYLGELLRLVIVQLLQTDALDMKVDKASKVFQPGGVDCPFLSSLALIDPDDFDGASVFIQATLQAENVSQGDVQAIRLLATSIARRAARLAGASLAAIIIQSGRLDIRNKCSEQTTPVPASRTDRLQHPVTLRWRRLLGCIGMSSQASKPIPRHADLQTRLDEDIIDIGADGALIEFYPGFEAEMRGAVRDVAEIGEAGERRIRIGLAKDGSGVGAALMAQAASQCE